MSLILDALRKSDRQRNRAATEQLRWAPGPARPAGPGRLVVIIAIALTLALTVAAGAWLGSRLASQAGTQARTAADEHETAGNAGQGENRKAAAPPGEVRALSGELASRRRTAQQSNTAATADTAEETSLPLIDDTILHAPALSEMTEEFRAGLPALIINVHAWTEQPAQRFILINMQRYSEGERLREGPVVRQITPDGVVLEHQGEIFSLSQR